MGGRRVLLPALNQPVERGFKRRMREEPLVEISAWCGLGRFDHIVTHTPHTPQRKFASFNRALVLYISPLTLSI